MDDILNVEFALFGNIVFRVEGDLQVSVCGIVFRVRHTDALLRLCFQILLFERHLAR